MSGDIHIRVEGRAGRITLNRPKSLNALTHDMCLAIESALDAWTGDDSIELAVIDASGEKAFCAGGDVQEMHRSGSAGDYEYGRAFWRDEYRLNAKLFHWPKPFVAFMQGFVMGGGVGISCHGSHRVVGGTSRIAMPECGIGLVPDVGGSLLLAQAPGRLGEYLGVTGTRMNAADAIHAGFADYFIDESDWPRLILNLVEGGGVGAVDRAAADPPDSPLSRIRPDIDRLFTGERLADIVTDLGNDGGPVAEKALEAIRRNSPLSMACSVETTHRLRGSDDITRALDLEYRFTSRSMEHGDFLEGVRAAVIDKDRAPRWRHESPSAVPAIDVSRMLMPQKDHPLGLELPTWAA